MDTRECPLCGESMQMKHRTIVDQIPGTNEVKTREFEEWSCPECDYFEEAGED